MPIPTPVVERRPRRSPEPLARKPEPACGPNRRLVRGKRGPTQELPVDPDAEARGCDAIERLIADPRRAARGE